MPKLYKHTLTIDASVDARRRVVGVGIVIQESIGGRGRGPIIDRLAEFHPWFDLGNAEEFAIFRALTVARDRGYTRIKIRCDDNATRTAIRKAHRGSHVQAPAGLRSKLLTLASTFDYVDFGWVPRRKNQQAHALSRSARYPTDATVPHGAPLHLVTVEPAQPSGQQGYADAGLRDD
jgi:ribonuclease HI